MLECSNVATFVKAKSRSNRNLYHLKGRHENYYTVNGG